MNKERIDHTLSATDLVHELFLQIQADSVKEFQNANHFVAFSEEKMRRYLVDYARKKAAIKHGGKLKKCPLDKYQDMFHDPEKILILNDLVEQLEKIPSPRTQMRARLAKLIIFSGCNVREAAEELEISVAIAEKQWGYARKKMQSLWRTGNRDG